MITCVNAESTSATRASVPASAARVTITRWDARNVRADVTTTAQNVDLKMRTVHIVATMTARADVTTTVPNVDLKVRTARAVAMMTAQNAGLMAKAVAMTPP